jgi:N-acetylglutamate synthase-like GNAT family acetyltransferase
MCMVAERAAAATDEVTISETRDVPIPALRALQETAPWARGRSHAQLRTLLRHSDIFLTAWDGTRLVGCARVLTDFTVRALICDVIVHPAYQGRGIGRLLVEATEAHPALQHVEMLCLFTTEKHDFYAHLGWEDHPGHGMILRRR